MAIESGNINVSQAVGVGVPASKDNGSMVKRNAEAIAPAAAAQPEGIKRYEQSAPKEQQEAVKVEQLSSEELAEIVQSVQDFVGVFNNKLRFSVDENSGQQVVTVVDDNSGKVIRQIPSEEMLKRLSDLSDSSGILLGTKV